MSKTTKGKTEIPLRDRLWPEEPNQEKSTNPQWGDIPLANRLWPEETWPPMELLQLPPSPGVDHEIKRLFTEYCKRGMDGWD